jgi:hypothetical protein
MLKYATGDHLRRHTPVYHGERARFHYFQCLQLLLRKQIEAITELWHLPPEFEVGTYTSLLSYRRVYAPLY